MTLEAFTEQVKISNVQVSVTSGDFSALSQRRNQRWQASATLQGKFSLWDIPGQVRKLRRNWDRNRDILRANNFSKIKKKTTPRVVYKNKVASADA